MAVDVPLRQRGAAILDPVSGDDQFRLAGRLQRLAVADTAQPQGGPRGLVSGSGGCQAGFLLGETCAHVLSRVGGLVLGTGLVLFDLVPRRFHPPADAFINAALFEGGHGIFALSYGASVFVRRAGRLVALGPGGAVIVGRASVNVRRHSTRQRSEDGANDNESGRFGIHWVRPLL